MGAQFSKCGSPEKTNRQVHIGEDCGPLGAPQCVRGGEQLQTRGQDGVLAVPGGQVTVPLPVSFSVKGGGWVWGSRSS